MKAEYTWTELLVKQLKLVAQIFTNALTRKRAEAELRESEARLSLATDAAGVGLWIMEIATDNVWVTPNTRELVHFAPDAELNYNTFLKAIHPEDRERVDQVVQQALQSDGKFEIDYRIVLPDENTRWIAACGKRFLKSTGELDRLMGVSIDISERKRMEGELNKRLKEIEELKHVIERALIITAGTSLIMTDQLIPSLPGDSNDELLKDLAAAEREHILRVLQETGWRIEGPP